MAKVIDGLVTAMSRTRFNGFTPTPRNLRAFTLLFLVMFALWCLMMTKSSIPSHGFSAAAISSSPDANAATGGRYRRISNDSAAKPIDGAAGEAVSIPISISSERDGEEVGGGTNTLPRDTATFVISCGTQVTDAVGEMQPLLASMLAFASGPLRLVFLTDASGATRVERLFSADLGHYKRRLEVRVLVVPNKHIEAFAYRVKLDPYGDRTGRWAIAKLMVPWLLPDYDRVAVVDTDMIFMDDPLELWKEHAHDDGRWVYRMPLNNRHSNNDICSCIVLFNLKRARRLHVYPRLFLSAFAQTKEVAWYSKRKRLWRPDHGDQGMYWILMGVYPDLFSALPQKWNREKCHNYSWIFKPGSKVDVGIFHRNCGGTDSRTFKDDANHQFNFFLHYKWHWLKASPEDGFKVSVFQASAPAMPTS